MSVDDAQMYRDLDEITQQEVLRIYHLGDEIACLKAMGAGKWELGLDKIARMVDPHKIVIRDQLIRLHLGNIVSLLFRNSYFGTGIMTRNLLGEWDVATEDRKQEIIASGYPVIVGTASRPEDLDDLAPLPRVKDSEYTELYEKLEKDWGFESRQVEMGKKMELLLKTIHSTLSPRKIGNDLHKVRNFKGQPRREPLPLYVRNEIHHPSTKKRNTWEFERDKSIAFAILKVWA